MSAGIAYAYCNKLTPSHRNADCNTYGHAHTDGDTNGYGRVHANSYSYSCQDSYCHSNTCGHAYTDGNTNGYSRVHANGDTNSYGQRNVYTDADTDANPYADTKSDRRSAGGFRHGFPEFGAEGTRRRLYCRS